MSETTSNVEFAHKIHEHGHHHPPTDRREQWVEMVEAAVLAIVAVATAWSGYQAAKWDALSNQYYGLALMRQWLHKRKQPSRTKTAFTTSPPLMVGLQRK